MRLVVEKVVIHSDLEKRSSSLVANVGSIAQRVYLAVADFHYWKEAVKEIGLKHYVAAQNITAEQIKAAMGDQLKNDIAQKKAVELIKSTAVAE